MSCKEGWRADYRPFNLTDCVCVLVFSQILQTIVFRSMNVKCELVSHVNEFVFHYTISVIVVEAWSHESESGQCLV